jgi:hypothetical protein
MPNTRITSSKYEKRKSLLFDAAGLSQTCKQKPPRGRFLFEWTLPSRTFTQVQSHCFVFVPYKTNYSLFGLPFVSF